MIRLERPCPAGCGHVLEADHRLMSRPDRTWERPALDRRRSRADGHRRMAPGMGPIASHVFVPQ